MLDQKLGLADVEKNVAEKEFCFNIALPGEKIALGR